MPQPTTNRAQRATFALMALRYKQQLGAAIRARRLELGMSQKDLAAATHVKEPQTISRWERGETVPSDLDAVARALKTTISELHAGIRPPKRVAHKLDIAPVPEAAQLQRIEDMLSQLVEEQAAFRVEVAQGVLAMTKRLDAERPRATRPRRQQQP